MKQVSVPSYPQLVINFLTKKLSEDWLQNMRNQFEDLVKQGAGKDTIIQEFISDKQMDAQGLDNPPFVKVEITFTEYLWQSVTPLEYEQGIRFFDNPSPDAFSLFGEVNLIAQNAIEEEDSQQDKYERLIQIIDSIEEAYKSIEIKSFENEIKYIINKGIGLLIWLNKSTIRRSNIRPLPQHSLNLNLNESQLKVLLMAMHRSGMIKDSFGSLKKFAREHFMITSSRTKKIQQFDKLGNKMTPEDFDYSSFRMLAKKYNLKDYL